MSDRFDRLGSRSSGQAINELAGVGTFSTATVVPEDVVIPID